MRVLLLAALYQIQLLVGGFSMGSKGGHPDERLGNLADKKDDCITILGFGSLLSESSSRLTFPELDNFRLVRVRNYRRVFAHPASIFFQRGIADKESKEMSSLSVEWSLGNVGFVASAFEVPNNDMMDDGIPSHAFLEREEEFDIIEVPYEEMNTTNFGGSKLGIICTRSSDQAYIERWGHERFQNHFKKYGIDTIWNWKENSGLRPCAIYLRHCYLGAKSMGTECCNSFLDDTTLVDRTTTVREYLAKHSHVLQSEPPPDLRDRYSG